MFTFILFFFHHYFFMVLIMSILFYISFLNTTTKLTNKLLALVFFFEANFCPMATKKMVVQIQQRKFEWLNQVYVVKNACFKRPW